MRKRMKDEFCLTPEMASNDPVTAARAYIKAGLRLVVTHGITDAGKCTCRQDQCSHPGKHPIARYFPHGAKSSTDDYGPDGQEAVDALGLPPTISARTGRGRHLYFRGAVPGRGFKANKIDVITGANRYVMLPPSIHETGAQYRWEDSDIDFAAPVPKSLSSLKDGKGQLVTKKVRIPEGKRNDVLFRTACAIRRWISNADVILKMMEVANSQATTKPLPTAELRSLVASAQKYETPDAHDGELFGPPDDRKPKPMKWLWFPYIPRYGVTILAGDPGRGKSMLVAKIIGIVTSGATWPLSDERPSGNKVLILSAEDNWARATLPRLLEAGANIGNIHIMKKFRALTNERLAMLEQEVQDWKPDVIFIDTLSAYMGSERDMHRQNEVGEFLARLTEIAESVGCAVLGLAHLNKQSEETPLYRIVGSIGFAATIRSALFLGTDPDSPGTLALAHGKASASEKGRTILWEKEGGGRDGVPVLKALRHSDLSDKMSAGLKNVRSAAPVERLKTRRRSFLSFSTPSHNLGPALSSHARPARLLDRQL